MFSTPEISREPRTVVLGEPLWLAIAGVVGIIVLAVLGRAALVQADTPEFVAREYYDR